MLTGFAFLIVPYGYDYIDRAIVGSEGRFLTAERYYRTFDQLYERMTAAFSLEYWAPRWTLLAALLTALVLWRYLRGRMSPVSAQAALAGVLVFDVLLAPAHAIATVPAEWYAREPQAGAVVPGRLRGRMAPVFVPWPGAEIRAVHGRRHATGSNATRFPGVRIPE